MGPMPPCRPGGRKVGSFPPPLFIYLGKACIFMQADCFLNSPSHQKNTDGKLGFSPMARKTDLLSCASI